MTLSDEATERLADVVALQPTKNGELQDRWDMDSGSDVHQYLESELKDFYYRNEDSLICATPEAAEIVTDAGLIEEGAEDDTVVQVPPIQAHILHVLAEPDDDAQSVVSVFHDLEDAGHDYEVDDVRSALHSLVDKGVVERNRKTVPTFRLSVPRESLTVATLD